ncbi:disulfide oxidoreductase YuzD [Bacillus oleivorans]|uniref:Disulfide oxidoreductase YuzD n=1 Tax=Bacillus oleivorans TaxID=1448271 RepID=A0A285D7K8_9BACI|nr:disulfide oxidoreductase YuzD [Bacillus oleivorans]
MKPLSIYVYGAEQICASCVNLPSSKETYEWLQAAIARKYPDQPFQIEYIDIFNPPAEKAKQEFAKRVVEEDLFYPIILIDDKIVGEGNPKLKTIFAEMETHGYTPAS